MGVMTVERRVLITAGRVLDLLTVGRLTDELLATLLVLELLFLMGVTTVLRREVDEPADEPVPLRLATSTERLTGREKDGRVVETLGVDLDAGLEAIADLLVFGDALGRDDETLGDGFVVLGGALGRGAETLGAGLDLVVFRETVGRGAETLGADLGAGLGAGADLIDFGREAGRERETLGAGLAAGLDAGLLAGLAAGLGAGLLAGLDAALGADRDTRRDGADLAGEAGRDFDADFGAALLAGDDLAEDLDDLPLGGAALPNAGPKVIIAVNSTANSVFSICFVNISRSLSSITVITTITYLTKYYATNDQKSSNFFIFVNFFLLSHVNRPKHLCR